MSKAVLGALISEKHAIPRVEAEKIVDTVLEGIKSALQSHGHITFVGFGSFRVEERAGRMGRNPSTGAPVEIPSTKVIKFKVGEPLKELINKKHKQSNLSKI